VPKGCGPSGRALWRSLHRRFVFEPHEVRLLTDLVRTVDLVDRLQEALDESDDLADVDARRLATEVRGQRLTAAKLVAALRLPDVGSAAPAAQRTQRRPGRGVYRIGGGS
jgi:hypothetical protein